MDSGILFGIGVLLAPIAIPILIVIGVIFLTKSDQNKSAQKVTTCSDIGAQNGRSSSPLVMAEISVRKKDPFVTGIRSGVALSAKWIFFLGSIWGFLVLLEAVLGGHGAGGIVGFLLVPVAMLTGAPWSIFMFEKLGPTLFLVGCAAGILLNGLIFGLLKGGVAKARSTRNV
jgi:hypothetical protein